MKQFAPNLKRLAVVSSVALGLATVASWYNYRSYWHGTIRRVQTVDFNILSHVLPTKLSYALINRDLEELQRTLDSNYGYFGMVVTDCVKQEPECFNQQILYSTNSKFSWKQQLDPKALSELPYNILKNPPPLQTEARFNSARDETWEATGNTNKGQIIGRVYYVRGIPPTFSADLADWIKKLPGSLLAGSGADKYYSLTFGVFFFSGIALWGGIEFVLYRKKILEQIAKERQRRLEIEHQIGRERQERVEQEKERLKQEKEKALFEAETLKEKLIESDRKISTLITQREKVLSESEALQKRTQQQALQLESEILQTKRKLEQSQHQYEQKLAAELQVKTKTEEMLVVQKQIIAQLEQKQQEKFQKLESEILQTKSKLEQSQHQYEQKLAAELQVKTKTEEMLLAQKQIIAQLEQKQQEKVQTSQQLQTELEAAQSRLEELQDNLVEQTKFIAEYEAENENSKEFFKQEIFDKQQALKQADEKLLEANKNNQKQKELLAKLKIDKNEIEQKYQTINKQLESNIEKLQEELERTKTALIEQKNLEDYQILLEEENERLKQSIENFEDKIDELEAVKYDDDSKYKSLEAEYLKYQKYYHELTEKIAIYQKNEVSKINLSSKTIALIGGDRETRTRIIKDLCNDFNLKKYIEIPPSWEQKMDRSNVKLKIRNAHFIFHFTGINKHDSQNILRQLKHQICGKIVPINSNGYTGGLRDILDYLAN